MRRQRKDKEGEEREMQKVREEVFRATRVIYIEPPLVSKPPLVFRKNSESYGEERDVKHENFEALNMLLLWEKDLKKKIQGL